MRKFVGRDFGAVVRDFEGFAVYFYGDFFLAVFNSIVEKDFEDFFKVGFVEFNLFENELAILDNIC